MPPAGRSPASHRAAKPGCEAPDIRRRLVGSNWAAKPGCEAPDIGRRLMRIELGGEAGMGSACYSAAADADRSGRRRRDVKRKIFGGDWWDRTGRRSRDVKRQILGGD